MPKLNVTYHNLVVFFANLKLGQLGHANVDIVPILWALGPTPPGLQCAPWVRRSRRGTDHTILSSAEVYTSTSHTYIYISSWRTYEQLGLFCKTNACAHTLFVRNYVTQLTRTKIPTITHQPSAETRSVLSSAQNGVTDVVSSLMQQVQFSLVTYFLHWLSIHSYLLHSYGRRVYFLDATNRFYVIRS